MGGLGSGAVTLGSTGTTGVLDLGGFNQTVFVDCHRAPGATANNQLVGNSSTATNSVLTVNGSFDLRWGSSRMSLGGGNKTTGTNHRFGDPRS